MRASASQLSLFSEPETPFDEGPAVTACVALARPACPDRSAQDRIATVNAILSALDKSSTTGEGKADLIVHYIGELADLNSLAAANYVSPPDASPARLARDDASRALGRARLAGDRAAEAAALEDLARTQRALMAETRFATPRGNS